MVGKTSYILTTLLAASVQISCHAFAPSGSPSGNRLGVLAASSDDAAAQVMSEYMAKSHAEKLRAVREVEQKKNSEIEALKAEIEQLKSAAVPVAAVASGSGGGLFEQRNAKVIASAEAGKSRWGDMEVERAAEQVKSAPSSDPIVAELQEKVESYQKFIADYIVNAQNQKLLAVKEAELKAEKKFQERLEQLFANSGMLLPGSGEDTAPPENLIAAEPTLYDKRNARVVAAATAGKSRWGAMEVEKVEELVKNSAVTTEEVAASVESAESTLFEQRNAKIVAAAGAGKSRWGSKEVERAAQLNGEELKVEDPPKVKKITLEERVNLGARLLEA